MRVPIRSLLYCGAVLAMASRAAAAGVENTFGPDDREPLTTDRRPWSAIGKLHAVGCTGTLIWRDLVLTAAHCVVDEGTRRRWDGLTHFLPNHKHGASLLSSRITRVWLGTEDPLADRGRDWAILRLAEPVGDAYGWLDLRYTDPETFPPGLTVAGYSGDFMNAGTAGVHHNCATRNRYPSRNFILHDCDTARGSSGGPALRMYGGRLTIVGVNVAEYRDGGESSLQLPHYEDDHANIVITTQDLYGAFQDILRDEAAAGSSRGKRARAVTRR